MEPGEDGCQVGVGVVVGWKEGCRGEREGKGWWGGRGDEERGRGDMMPGEDV